MKDQSELDTKLMFDQGCAFVDCAEYTELETYKINHRTYSHGFAGISLSALACEIFLKCLIIHNRGSYHKQHELKELWTIYKSLDEETTVVIETWMKNWFQSSDPDMFDRMIDEASLAFVQWRYVFDYDSGDGVKINRQFIRGFRIILQEVCCEAVHGSTWSEFTAKH